MAWVSGFNHFQIKGNGVPNDQLRCQVYKNGRQQIQVDIVIDAYGESQQVVILTPAQMSTVKLIDYDSGADIASKIIKSDTKNIYDFYPGSFSTSAPPRRQNMSTLSLFISAPTSMNKAALHIAAEITLDGTIYRTNKRSSAGGGHFNDGGFNSSIILVPVAPYVLRASNFTVLKAGSLGYGADAPYTGGPRNLELWKINLNTDNKIYQSTISHTKPISWFSQYIRGGDDLDTCQWALPVLPVGSKVYLGFNRDGASTSKDIFIHPYTAVGEAYGVIERASNFQIHDYKSKPITYIDNNGCSHSVFLLPNNNGTTLQIADTAIG